MWGVRRCAPRVTCWTDEKAKLHVTLKSRTGRTKHIRKTVKVKYLERELKKIEKKGRIVDVEVTTAD